MFLSVVLTGSGCAGPAPATVDDTPISCPEISGSYCARGERWRAGDTDLGTAHLAYELGIDDYQTYRLIDRVDIVGVTSGRILLTLFTGDTEIGRAELREPKLRCGVDRVVLPVGAVPWGGGMGGPFPVIAIGGSSGWRQLHRDERGALRVVKQVRNTGALYLAIPISWKDESWLRFRAAGAGGCGGS